MGLLAPIDSNRLTFHTLNNSGETAMKRAAVFLAGALCAGWLAGQESGKKPREESMSSDRFAEAHAPLFRPPNSTNAGALTDRIARSLPASANTAGDVPMRNFIDQQIFGKMRKDGVPHAPLCSDYEFLRRVTLDLTGRIPSPDEVRAFV